MINKPGSHRGAANIKKGKFVRGEKKKAVPVFNKVKEFVLEKISIAEKNSKTGEFYETHFKCIELAKMFNCRIGDVAISINKLYHEGLTSEIRKRYMSFSIEYEAYERKEEEILNIYFDYKNCPVCSSELTVEESSINYNEYDENNKRIKFKTITRLSYHCKNNCFKYKATPYEHEVNIFNEVIKIGNNEHKSIVNDKIKVVERFIEKEKKNERYLIKIMMNKG